MRSWRDSGATLVHGETNAQGDGIFGHRVSEYGDEEGKVYLVCECGAFNLTLLLTDVKKDETVVKRSIATHREWVRLLNLPDYDPPILRYSFK